MIVSLLVSGKFVCYAVKVLRIPAQEIKLTINKNKRARDNMAIFHIFGMSPFYF